MHFLTSIIAALRLACFAGCAGAALIFGATASIAESGGRSEAPEKDVELDLLIEAIDDYGQWRQHEIYGDVWIPRVDEDWRPYTLGQWAHDDAAGWTWVSEEPFGWVVYHYGRWSQNDELGWFWVPGTKWAPAWVAWRESDEHIGWAPLPPEPPEYTGPPYEHTVIYDEPRYEAFWVFATYALFARPHIHRHAIWHRHRHYSGIYRKSRRGHHARWRHRRIVNRGISLRELRKRARRHIRPARAVITDRAHGKRRRGGHGLVHVYRPSPGTKPQRKRRHLHEGRRFYNADNRRAARQRVRASRAAVELRERRRERRQSDSQRSQKREVAAPDKRASRGAEALRRRAQQKRQEAAKRRDRQEARSKARDNAARKDRVQQKARALRKAQAQRKARAQNKARAQSKARAQRRAAANRKVQRRAVEKRKARAQRSVRRKAASRPRARASRAHARPRARAQARRAARPQKARSRGGQHRR